MTKEREGEIFMLGLSLLESWFPIFSIIAMKQIGALYTYGFSLIIALVFFLTLMFKKSLFHEFNNKNAHKNLLLTAFWITLLFLLVFIGMQYTSAGNMAVIIFLQLLFSYLYFNILGKEKMHISHTIGAVIMSIGALLILFPDDFSLNKGDLIILLAAAIAPIANMYSKRAREESSTESILTFRTMVAIPFVFVLAFFLEDTLIYDNFLIALPYLFFIGLLIFGVSKILWVEALHRISITKISALLALVPLLTLFFAYLFLDEIPELRSMLGVIPIIVGGYLITKPINLHTQT